MKPTDAQKSGILRHLRYEVMRCVLIEEGEDKFPEYWVSHILHARVLIDFFEDDPGTKDDVISAHFGFPARPLKISKWYRDKLNKDLAHLTYERVNRTLETQGWNLQEVILPIAKRAKEFTEHLLKNPPMGADAAELDQWRELSKIFNAPPVTPPA